MSLKILLVRHAKSSWKHPDLDDFDRPLNKRGQRDAPLMGQRITHYNLAIDLIVSSPAKRAKATAKSIALELAYPNDKIVHIPQLYHTSLSLICDVLRTLNGNTIMLCGHNPSLHYLSHWLCGSPSYNINAGLSKS